MGVKLLLAGWYGHDDVSGPEAPRPWLRRVEGWLRETADAFLEGSRVIESSQGPILLVRLHPAADDVAIVAAGQGRVVVSANTSMVGPGYHRFLCDVLHDLGEALEVDWAEPGLTTEGVGDPTGYFHTGDASGIAPRMLAWLGEMAGRVLDFRHQGHSGATLSLRAGRGFEYPGAVLTPMGPRDEAWLRAVREDPRIGQDIFPWWEPGLGATVKLGWALSRIWTEMVWRPPLLEEERHLFREVARLLEQAWREDPSLAYPWREWQQVLGYLGVGGTLAEEVSRRAAAAPVGPLSGYRRGVVQVTLPEGWEIRIPGSLAEQRLADGSWVARDHRRSVRFLPLRDVEGIAPGPEKDMPYEFQHRGERVHGRATLQGAEGEYRLTALCESGEHRALCVVSFDDPDEQDWALGTWRSLDHAVAA
ncbi:hypothetical protein [Melittangium boletus]|uniref:Uncharacterized protein n=1 Tax=Melittangium boletus DSM 14713 TaxID=1294270 RepID=A0A250IKD9_9BACT|nr:hypothetical protein [Melittangium boletus]ATB31680.1 hypothetical protein MEBOL_005143 [Melittangium boletus DSM 14713]